MKSLKKTKIEEKEAEKKIQNIFSGLDVLT